MNIRNCLIICLALAGCRYLPCGVTYDLDNIDKNVFDQVLIGAYLPDQNTRGSTPGYNSETKAQLILNSDHTFTLSGFPKSTFDFEANYQSDHNEVTASGKWHLYVKDNQPEIQLNYDFEDALEDYISSYEIYEKDGRPVILIGIGDPDECNYARLEKQDVRR